MASGLLIGAGLLILVIAQFLKPALAKPGLLAGMAATLAGLIGLLTSGRIRPR